MNGLEPFCDRFILSVGKAAPAPEIIRVPMRVIIIQPFIRNSEGGNIFAACGPYLLLLDAIGVGPKQGGDPARRFTP